MIRSLPLLLALTLAGCADLERRAEIDRRSSVVPNLYDQGRGARERMTIGNVTIDNESLLLGDRIEIDPHGAPLPEAAERPGAVHLRAASPQPFEHFAEQLAGILRIPVRPPGRCELAGGHGEAVPVVDLTRTALFNHSGPASEVLTRLAAAFGLSWSHDGGAIRFDCLETRVFRQAVQPDLVLTGAAGGARRSDGETILEGLKETLKLLLAGEGTFQLEPVSGDLVVRTSPVRMQEVARYLERSFARQQQLISIEVTVLTLELEGSDTVTVNLAAAFSDIVRNQPVIFQSLAGSVAGFAGVVSEVPSGMRTGTVDAVLGALSTLGRISKQEGGFIKTQSEVAGSFKRTREIYYVDSALTTEAGLTTGTQTRTQLSKIEVGFDLQVRPRLLPGGRVSVSYDLSVDELLKLETITNAQGQVVQQRPEVARRRSRESVPLAVGETLVAGGYVLDDARSDAAAPLWASVPVLGGSRSSMGSSTVSVILLTPRVANPGQPSAGLRS